MTADAKVGLLLGLFFIVIIAFLVNGLPNFIHQEKPLPPDAAIKTPTAPDIVLDNRVPEAVYRLNPNKTPRRHSQPPQEEIVLDKTPTQPAQIKISPLPHSPSDVEIAKVTDPPVKIQNSALDAAKPASKLVAKSITHIVQSGENLAVIAQKYYKEEGNRRVVIQKLYETNSSVLKSPSEVWVGDKLIIPPLEQLLATSDAVVEAPNPTQTLLDKFSDIFEKAGNQRTLSFSEYVVQKDDSLWSIAKEKLGDGNRYKEIARLNKIKDADNVPCGVRLKIPAR